jgi:quercetin dioxygenase-like cupin family protein
VKQPSLSVIEEHMPPGTSEVKHHHSLARQFFFVIRGELRLEVEGREYELRPDDGLEIHRGRSTRRSTAAERRSACWL